MTTSLITRRTVIVALHDQSRLNSYVKVLEREGFEVRTATNGLACLAQLQDQMPEILVIEQDLPWGGGDGVLAYLREDPLLSSPSAIIVLSEKPLGQAYMRYDSRHDFVGTRPEPRQLARRLRRLVQLVA
ncbi:MAG: response regulator [Planctomycetes bacterium]|nr:response regulator [Planctomycetota bacterium]